MVTQRPMRVLKMWMWGSFFCSKQIKNNPLGLGSLMNDDLLDDLIIIIQDSPLFQSWICMLNDWVTSCFPRAGLWDLFRCLELSLESGDWGNDLWAYPVEIDIFSTKINVNKISEWEKTYGNLWCFTGIIRLSFLKKSLSSYHFWYLWPWRPPKLETQHAPSPGTRIVPYGEWVLHR